MDLAHIIQNMTILQASVAITLCVMAIASLAVFVERLYTFMRARAASTAFAPIAAKMLHDREYRELLKEADKAKNAPLAGLIAAGTKAFLAAKDKPGKLSAIELTKRELVRKSDAVAADVKRGMSVLASVGSVAPFVGLLGTVVGIIGAFEAMKRDGSAGITTVGGAIGEALIVTAFGLMVAIPAVLAYNFLTNRADGLMLAVDQAKSEFIDHLEAYHGDGAAQASAGAAAEATRPAEKKTHAA